VSIEVPQWHIANVDTTVTPNGLQHCCPSNTSAWVGSVNDFSCQMGENLTMQAISFKLSSLCKVLFALAKLSTIMPATGTGDSHHCSCFGYFGQRDRNRNDLNCQGK